MMFAIHECYEPNNRCFMVFYTLGIFLSVVKFSWCHLNFNVLAAYTVVVFDWLILFIFVDFKSHALACACHLLLTEPLVGFGERAYVCDSNVWSHGTGDGACSDSSFF